MQSTTLTATPGPGRAALTSRPRWSHIRTIAYWALTLIVGFEMVQGSMWDLVGTDFATAVAAHLGYPHYLGFVLGVAKLLCGVALLVPRFERLKEWAYAGAIFNYVGAAASLLLVGDGFSAWVVGAPAGGSSACCTGGKESARVASLADSGGDRHRLRGNFIAAVPARSRSTFSRRGLKAVGAQSVFPVSLLQPVPPSPEP